MVQGLKPNQTLLVAMFAASLCWTSLDADEPTASPTTNRQTVANGKLSTETLEQLKILKKEADDAKPHKIAPQPIAEKNIPRMIELLRQDPDSEFAFETLNWIMLRAGVGNEPYALGAVELLRDHHAANTNINWLCHEIGWYWPYRDEWKKQPTMDLLRAVAEKNPDRATRGQATLALARLTRNKSAYLECFQNAIPAMLQTQSKEHIDEYLARWRGEDVKTVSAEAGRLFDIVMEQYGDCPLSPKQTKVTLARHAAPDIYELCNLALGKVVPEVEGKDVDGTKFKLSDYRGKVVVISFWATWCPSCMQAVPKERALVDRMRGKPFALIGVNGDSNQAKLRTAIEKNKMDWRSFADGGPEPMGPISRRWNVINWPIFYVLDPNGVIRFKATDDAANLDDAVDQVMSELQSQQHAKKM